MELNLKPRSSRHNDRQSMALRALELGYSTIVWNVAAFGKLSQYKPIPEVILSSAQLKSIRLRRGLVVPQEPAPTSSSLRQFSRLTVSVEDTAEAQQLTISNEALQPFDIIAATPVNVKVFAHLCKQSDVDIICLDFSHRQTFPFNKKLLDCAVQRGISFEITYSPLFQAPATRRSVISNTKLFLQYLNGRNTIVTSGAEVVSHMRGPQEAVQLGLFLGVPTVKAAKTVREHCSAVLQHAAARKQRYLPLEILSSDEFEKRWPELTLRSVQTAEPIATPVGDDTSGDINISDCDVSDDDVHHQDDNTGDIKVPDKCRSSDSTNDVDETDGFLSFGGSAPPSDDENEPSYNPTMLKSSTVDNETLSFANKLQQQSKKRRKEKGANGGGKKMKKSKR